MIVGQVDIHNLSVFEAEYDAPVARDPDAPLLRPVDREWMQAEARCSSVFWMRCLLQAE